jgi:hypothetical protein
MLSQIRALIGCLLLLVALIPMWLFHLGDQFFQWYCVTVHRFVHWQWKRR